MPAKVISLRAILTVVQKDAISSFQTVSAVVLRRSVLRLLLFLMTTAVGPNKENMVPCMFAHDTVITATDAVKENLTEWLQVAFNNIDVRETKSLSTMKWNSSTSHNMPWKNSQGYYGFISNLVIVIFWSLTGW